jgi:uncharacterized protein (TIGR02145 family)
MKTIVIGDQEWSVENSSIKAFRNGDVIPEVQDPKEWMETKSPAWCYFENDIQNSEFVGVLYNGYAITDARNLAPDGFRIPTIEDFAILIKFLGSDNLGYKLKTKTKGKWKSMKNVTKGTDEFGFNAYPSGIRVTSWGNAPFVNQKEYTRFWTISKKDNLVLLAAQLGYGDDWLYISGKIHSETSINAGCSLRFIKDI